MMNQFTVKKYAVLTLLPFLSCIFYLLGSIFYGFIGGVIFLFCSLIINVPIGVLLLKNPFSMMLEGKGILTLDINSTGVIRPYISQVDNPYIKLNIKGKEVTDVFDRNSVFQISTPKKAKHTAKPKDRGGITINLDEDEYNDARFALFHYPVIIYNSQIGSVITKDFLSNKESEIFSEHLVLYLNRKMEELTSVLRDFSRYVVEQLKPIKSILQNKWFLIAVLVIAAIIFIALFGKPILQNIQGFGSNLAPALDTGANAVKQTITPN